MSERPPAYAPPPSLNAVRAFAAAARLQSYRKAARELGVSPAAVSQQIARLERHLGVALFIRQPNRVRLTDAGRAMLPGVCAGLEQIAEGVEQAANPPAQIHDAPIAACLPSAPAAFVALCLQAGILRFGEFTLKSGRVSPYFFNAGLFYDGKLLGAIGREYARVIMQRLAPPPDPPLLLYGPAYKGITLAACTALQLFEHHNQPAQYAFNRKEVKDHGEGGRIVGAPLGGDVVLVDDVITAGTSVNESAELIQQHGGRLSAVVIALDRQERADNCEQSALQQVAAAHAVPVHAILQLQDLIDYADARAKTRAQNIGAFAKYADAMREYQMRYGVARQSA